MNKHSTIKAKSQRRKKSETCEITLEVVGQHSDAARDPAREPVNREEKQPLISCQTLQIAQCMHSHPVCK